MKVKRFTNRIFLHCREIHLLQPHLLHFSPSVFPKFPSSCLLKPGSHLRPESRTRIFLVKLRYLFVELLAWHHCQLLFAGCWRVLRLELQSAPEPIAIFCCIVLVPLAPVGNVVIHVGRELCFQHFGADETLAASTRFSFRLVRVRGRPQRFA